MTIDMEKVAAIKAEMLRLAEFLEQHGCSVYARGVRGVRGAVEGGVNENLCKA